MQTDKMRLTLTTNKHKYQQVDTRLLQRDIKPQQRDPKHDINNLKTCLVYVAPCRSACRGPLSHSAPMAPDTSQVRRSRVKAPPGSKTHAFFSVCWVKPTNPQIYDKYKVCFCQTFSWLVHLNTHKQPAEGSAALLFRRKTSPMHAGTDAKPCEGAVSVTRKGTWRKGKERKRSLSRVLS